MSTLDVSALAEEISAAYARRELMEAPSSRDPAFDLADAYAVEAELTRRRRADGWSAVGRKVGYANKALWRALKLETLVWAHMYDRTVQYRKEWSRLALHRANDFAEDRTRNRRQTQEASHVGRCRRCSRCSGMAGDRVRDDRLHLSELEVSACRFRSGLRSPRSAHRWRTSGGRAGDDRATRRSAASAQGSTPARAANWSKRVPAKMRFAVQHSALASLLPRLAAKRVPSRFPLARSSAPAR